MFTIMRLLIHLHIYVIPLILNFMSTITKIMRNLHFVIKFVKHLVFTMQAFNHTSRKLQINFITYITLVNNTLMSPLKIFRNSNFDKKQPSVDRSMMFIDASALDNNLFLFMTPWL